MRSIRVSPYTPFYAIMNGTKEFCPFGPALCGNRNSNRSYGVLSIEGEDRDESNKEKGFF